MNNSVKNFDVLSQLAYDLQQYFFEQFKNNSKFDIEIFLHRFFIDNNYKLKIEQINVDEK